MDCVHEVALSCGIAPKLLACSCHSGFVAVYGTLDQGARSCVLIASTSSSAQTLVKLPRHLDTAPAISLEWSPAGVEEMLLVGCEDGNVFVLSMSSVNRAGPDNVNWRWFDAWHAHSVASPAEDTKLTTAQWITSPTYLKWPSSLKHHRFATANCDVPDVPVGNSGLFQHGSDGSEPPGPDLHLPDTLQDPTSGPDSPIVPQEWVRPHVAMIAAITSDATVVVHRYMPMLAAMPADGPPALPTDSHSPSRSSMPSPWQSSQPQPCVFLPPGSVVSSATISAAWGGHLQILLAIQGYREDISMTLDAATTSQEIPPLDTAAGNSDEAIFVPPPATAPEDPPVHVQCATLSGSPFCPSQSAHGCTANSAPADFRLSGGAAPVGLFCMHDRYHRCVLLLTQHPGHSGSSWTARCVPVSEFYSVGCLCGAESKDVELAVQRPGECPQKPHTGGVGDAANKGAEKSTNGSTSRQWSILGGGGRVLSCVSGDGTMLAVAGRMGTHNRMGVAVLDIRALQKPAEGGQGKIHVRTASELPFLQASSTVAGMQWAPSSLCLMLLVCDSADSGLEHVHMHSGRVLLLRMADNCAFQLMPHYGASHPYPGPAVPQSPHSGAAGPRVFLLPDALTTFSNHTAFLSTLPVALRMELYPAVAEGVYIAYRAVWALLSGAATADIVQLLAWHCLRRKPRHGVVVHVAVIVLDDLLLQHNTNEYVAKQSLLTTLKVDILPLLFSVADEKERQVLHAHLMELRSKQIVVHAINQLSCFAIGWKCVQPFETGGMLSEEQVRNSRARGEYIRPWLQWAIGLLYSIVLDLKRLQMASPGEMASIVDNSPGLRGMQDVHFAKLLEKLLRLINTLKPASAEAPQTPPGGPAPSPPISVHHACESLDAPAVSAILTFWRVFLMKAVQHMRFVTEHPLPPTADMKFGIARYTQRLLPSWLELIRFCLRNHEYSSPPAGMEEAPRDRVAETVSDIRTSFEKINVPVATASQVADNLELLGLPVSMHAAVACASESVQRTMHALGPENLMHVAHGSSAASLVTSASAYKSATRAVEGNEATGGNAAVTRKRARMGPDAVSGLLPHQTLKEFTFSSGPAASDILGVRGLMHVEAIDASCGTLELPAHDEPYPSRATRLKEPSAGQLFWAPQPLQQMLRTCVGASPLTRQPWRRLSVQQPMHAAPAGGGSATGTRSSAPTATATGAVASAPGGVKPETQQVSAQGRGGSGGVSSGAHGMVQQGPGVPGHAGGYMHMHQPGGQGGLPQTPPGGAPYQVPGRGMSGGAPQSSGGGPGTPAVAYKVPG